MTNGIVTVAVDATDGTFSVNGHGGLGRLVDGGDAGDTYNWCPPHHDVEIDRPDTVTVTVLSTGPVRAELRIDARYRWPESSTPERRADELTAVRVATTLTLDAGSPHVVVTVELENGCRDHRLRAWFPLPEPAGSSMAETAFGIVERGLVAEGGPTERSLATYPSGRFVQAGGLTIAPDRQLEYELVDIRDGRAHALALTLLRASRMLSRGPMSTRPLPAGPEIELQGSQVLGRHVVRSAVACGEVDAYAMADDVAVPLLVTTGTGPETSPVRHQALDVAGAAVSSVRRDGTGRLEVRVHNPSDVPTTVSLGGRTGRRTDLRGRELEAVDGSFVLGPWAIATVSLDEG
jgi:alpha-mannosidase